MQEQLVAPFNALNGLELRKYILSRVEKKLEESNDFPEGLTFPWVRWTITILSYPQQDINDDPKFKIVDEAGIPPTDPADIVFDLNEIVDTPDKARIESGQEVPTPVPGPGLGIRDGKGFGPLSPPVLVDKLTPKAA
jgi:hypothetical protein